MKRKDDKIQKTTERGKTFEDGRRLFEKKIVKIVSEKTGVKYEGN